MDTMQSRPTAHLPTDRSLPIALLRAREVVMEPLREMLPKTSLSEQKWRVLRVLDENGPSDQTHIAQRACLLLPSLTRILRAMEEDGLLMRATGASDKRKSIVSITDRGREILDAQAAQTKAIFNRFENRFGAEDLNTLLDLLEKVQRLRTRT